MTRQRIEGDRRRKTQAAMAGSEDGLKELWARNKDSSRKLERWKEPGHRFAQVGPWTERTVKLCYPNCVIPSHLVYAD